MPSQEAEMHRIVVKPQKSHGGGLTIRIPRVSARELLFDWNAWKQLLSRTQIDEWLLGNLPNTEVAEVQVLADNGLGGSGICPVHKYQHLQIFPLNGEPMRCADAIEAETK